MRTISRYTLFILTLLILASCSKFRKIQKSPDWRLKYDAALEYYQDEKYNKASLLLEEILPIIRGTEEAELGNYYFAYSYFHQGQYVLSAHHFQEFVRVFGRSEYVMDATYMHAYSLYLQSPDYNLDQTSTVEAINTLQAFIEKYPTSEKVKEADGQIADLQIKLETKAYYNAKLYHKIKRFKAALIIFDNFQRDFPDSEFIEEVDFMGIETTYEYARVSITSKQEERFRSTINLYEEFIDKYPSSDFLEEAEQFFVKSREELTKFADQNKTDT